MRPLAPPTFHDAIRPGALSWVCAKDPQQLISYFRNERQPFLASLVRQRDRQKCHILYKPTLPGFRAVPDNYPATELLASVSTLAFLAKRDQSVGDGLDVLKTVMPAVPRSLRVTLALGGGVPNQYYSDALAYHFPATKHSFRRFELPSDDYDPWMQDVLKPGVTPSGPRVLMTRHAYEGDVNMGADMRDMLASLKDERIERSNLSWEGGDFQFALDIKDPQKLVLFYGTTAKRYWGAELTSDEFAHVLKLEFGADSAVYLGDATPHVDYSLSLLPADKIALLSEPVCNSGELARAALDLLLATYSPDTPQELREIASLWSSPGANVNQIRDWIQKARQAEAGWTRSSDKAAVARVNTSLKAACPHNPKACLHGAGLATLLSQQLNLLQRWTGAESRVSSERSLARRMLAVMEGQLSICDSATHGRLQSNARILSDLGYRVIRVPHVFAADWPGISYVNALTVERTVFVPRFGLGKIEQTWLNRLSTELPGSYRVIPVNARAVLLANGGVHCVTAIARQP